MFKIDRKTTKMIDMNGLATEFYTFGMVLEKIAKIEKGTC